MKPTIPGRPSLGLAKPKLGGAIPGLGKKPLPAMEVPSKTPLDKLKPTADLQHDVDAEIGAMDEGFRARMKAEAERFDAATGSGEYFIVCFANGAQCGAFLAGLAEYVASVRINENDLVVDGRDLARHMGIPIPDAKAVGKLPKIDPDLKHRSM
jgi:hypothetical protein